MKFGQLIRYNKIFFLRNHAENVAGRLVLDLSLFFKKALYVVKATCLQLSFNIYSIARNLAYNKNKPYKTSDY